MRDWSLSLIVIVTADCEKRVTILFSFFYPLEVRRERRARAHESIHLRTRLPLCLQPQLRCGPQIMRFQVGQVVKLIAPKALWVGACGVAAPDPLRGSKPRKQVKDAGGIKAEAVADTQTTKFHSLVLAKIRSTRRG